MKGSHAGTQHGTATPHAVETAAHAVYRRVLCQDTKHTPSSRAEAEHQARAGINIVIVDLEVFEFMPDAVLVAAADGSIVHVNRTAETLFGYDRSELLGRPVEILIPARFRAAHRSEREAYALAPRLRPMGLGLDLHALAKDGHEFSVEISLAPVQIGPETFTIAAVRDVSERKHLEARARQAEKAEEEIRQRDEVLAVASHELRGPVGIVQMQVRMLQRAAGDTIRDLNTMRERIQKIERNAQHLVRLVDDLLDVSHLREGEGAPKLNAEDMDLAEVARETAERLREELERRETPLVLNATAPVRGRWDPIRIEQVLTNLLMNAAKFGQGNPIAVSVEGNTDWARISVTDGGIGIAPEDQERIFQRFERASPSAEAARGLGLGLYIVRRIVEAHGGRVLVRSSIGSGSTFTVELPRVLARSA